MFKVSKSSFAQALLTQARVVLLPASPKGARQLASRQQHALTIQANIEGLGFGFRPEALKVLARLPETDQAQIYAETLPVLKDLVGVRRYEAFYPNFPQQVMDASDVELLFNALIHYTGNVFGIRWIPDYPKEKRPRLREKTADLKPLDVATPDEAVAIWQTWVSSPVAWSPDQQDAALAGLAWLWGKSAQTAQAALRSLDVPNRENKAVLMAGVLKLGISHPHLAWPLPSTTVTDVLRTAAAFSGGDPSLAQPTRFISFRRSQRRALLAMLEGAATTETAVEDLFARREAFLRLGERLHPGEMQTHYPQAARLFDRLRNGVTPPSFMAKLEAELASPADLVRVHRIGRLATIRPGLAARHLRRVLVWAGEDYASDVLDAFEATAGEVSTSILLNIAHALASQEAGAPRTVLPKGQVARMKLTPKPAPVVPASVAERAVSIAQAALIQRFRKLPPLGKVFVDPALDRVPTPFALRSASKALHTLPRGARAPMDPKAAVTRLFVWWNERGPDGQDVGRTDLDLSCVVFNKDFRQLIYCAFNDLRSSGLTHSGDVTSAPEGGSEFIDVEHAKLPKGSRYVGMVVTSYTGQPYADLPECFAGWMTRRAPRSGEIYEPRTVAQRFDLTCASKAVIPMVMDLETKEFIWLDMPYNAGYSYNAVALQGGTIGERIRELSHLSRPTLGELFALHVTARGTRVDRLEDADVALTLTPQTDKPGVCATDSALAGQWMGEADAEGWAPQVKSVNPKAKRPARAPRA